MNRYSFRLTLFSALAGLMLLPALAQDFQRSYTLNPGGTISISNISGDIAVTGYDGAAIQVKAFKEGPDRALVDVEDQSAGDRVSLRTRYPKEGSSSASVRYVVQVPRSIAYRFDSLATASGNIKIENVMGEINAKSASGDLSVIGASGRVNASTASGDVAVLQTIGTVRARTASGDVTAEIARVEGEGDLSFSTASGDVTVKATSDLSAEVSMSTASGSLQTDFPLSVDDQERGHGKKAFGAVGGGGRALKISSASGNVHLVYR